MINFVPKYDQIKFMKKILFIYSVLLMGVASAQSIKYGVTANFHKSSIAGIHGVSKGNYGANVGVFADFALVPNDIYDSAWLYFTPQLEFYTIGERADWDENDKNIQKYNNAYVAVPLYIKYYIRNHGYKGDIYLMAGPKFEFLVSEKQSEGNAQAEAIMNGFDPAIFGLGRKINTFGYGVSAKAGSRINNKMEVFIRFDRGLSKIYSDYSRKSTYNRFLGIGVSYYIGETN